MKKNNLYIIVSILLITMIFSCKKKPVETKQEDYYTCSMDPQVVEKKPGSCPICKMDLTKVSGAASSGIMLSEEQIELANIKTEIVDTNFIANEKVVTGEVVVNENLQSVITSRMDGRIDRLYFKDVGESIGKGQVMYEIYSEELATAQKDLLLLIKKEKQLTGFDIDYKQLVEAAKNKLLLWGITDQQIQGIIKNDNVQIPFPIQSKVAGIITDIKIKEGDYVMTGLTILKVADLSSVWVQAQIYSNEIPGLTIGKEVKINIEGFSDKLINGKISFINPQLVTKSKVDLIRIEVSNKEKILKPGMQASISFDQNTRRNLVINSNAVLRDSKGASVWKKKEDGSFENVMVHIGVQTKDKIEIMHGLEKGDQVVTSGAYLLHSEYIFKKGATPMEGHNMGKM